MTYTTPIATGHEGTVRDQFTGYIQRVRGGDMGALPAVLALVALAVLFSALPRSFARLEAVVREYGGMLLIVVMLIGARLISPLVKSAYLGLLGLAGLL
jgi:D-xylose transport system permease protein